MCQLKKSTDFKESIYFNTDDAIQNGIRKERIDLIQSERPIDINYALQESAKNGYLDLVEYLINKGANINDEDEYALQMSASNGHLDIVTLLLNNGATIHSDNDLALRFSAANGHIEIVKLLIDKGANIRASSDYALQWSASNGHLEVVKIIVEEMLNSKNVTIKCNVCSNALQLSALNGHLEIVKYLSSMNADIHANNNKALSNSVIGGHFGIVRYLMENINCDDLHLIQSNVFDNENKILLDAFNKEHLEIAHYLIGFNFNIHRVKYAALANVKRKDIFDYLLSYFNNDELKKAFKNEKIFNNVTQFLSNNNETELVNKMKLIKIDYFN